MSPANQKPDPELHPVEQTAQTVANRIKPWHLLVGIIISFGLGASAVWLNIRSAARDAVTNEKFLAELSAKVRPSCIFDSHETILSNHGGSTYIEDIRVRTVETNYGFAITLVAKQHLAYPPVVRCLNANLFVFNSKRGTKNDWLIEMAPLSTMHYLISEKSMDTNWIYQFQLEILH